MIDAAVDHPHSDAAAADGSSPSQRRADPWQAPEVGIERVIGQHMELLQMIWLRIEHVGIGCQRVYSFQHRLGAAVFQMDEQDIAGFSTGRRKNDFDTAVLDAVQNGTDIVDRSVCRKIFAQGDDHLARSVRCIRISFIQDTYPLIVLTAYAESGRRVPE